MQNTLSPSGSLAEWVALHNSYYDMDMGSLPMHLSTIPAAVLPEGVSQGIRSIGERPVNPPRQVWLAREDLVYNFSSTYNREEDMALIFAIISTLEFDPEVEAALRASGGLQGDESTLRERLAQAQAAVTPTCDFDCEYIKRMEELARWKTLPAPERPLVQPIIPAAMEGTWQRYSQPLLGISFRYGSFMEIVDPFAEDELDEKSLFDKAISIRQQNGSAAEEVMRIELFPYLAGDDIPLNNWEAIQDQLNRARDPLHQFEYRLIVPVEWHSLAGEADDIVHTQEQAPYYRVETFWLRKDHIVFRITSSYPPLAQFVPTIISTMQFDTERLEELRASDVFKGDERTMVEE
jgi:hypothetical protein